MRKIAPASDPVWAEAQHRTSQLLGLIALHDMSSAEVAKLTNKSESMVNQWRYGKYRVIPTEVLRALIYDLQPEDN
jgi:hypothetical protein